MNKYILIPALIWLILSFLPPDASGFDQGDQEIRYNVRFGDTYHNYSKGSYVRIGISFKNLKETPLDVSQEIDVNNSRGEKVWDTWINIQLRSEQEFNIPFMVPVPPTPGSYTLTIPHTAGADPDHKPSFRFVVIEPHISKKLSLITVVVPEWEDNLKNFVDRWEIKSSTISLGQVVLCGKKTLQRMEDGDSEARQMIDKALRRDMSVVFLDFGPVEIKENSNLKADLPNDIQVNFVKTAMPELNFIPDKSVPALNYDLPWNDFQSLNGFNGISIPPVDMNLTGREAEVTHLAITGKNPFRFPVIELKPKGRKGAIILSQVITEGRLDEKVIPPRNRLELPAYDPFAVQFVLNLISASVGNDLLK